MTTKSEKVKKDVLKKIQNTKDATSKPIKEKDDNSVIEETLEFDSNLLPKKIAPFIEDIANRMNKAPLSFAGTSALCVLSSSIGRRVGVRPKLNDDWMVVPNLWGMLVAPPSIKKSPIYKACINPLKQAEVKENEEYEKELKGYKEKKIIYDIEMKQYKKALEKGEENLTIPSTIPMPIRTRYIINDATIETVANIMIDNPNGLMLTQDELSGWFSTLNRAGRENDRSFYLEAFNGDDGKNVDRIGRGSSYVPFVCASIFGTIQPDVLSKLIFLSSDSSGGDGLIQRFQLIVKEDVSNWEYVDKQPNKLIK